jgi:hypothetical protein
MTTFEDLERERRVFLGRLEDWSIQRMRFKPDLKSWCALQVLDHLGRTESEILAIIESGSDKTRKIGLRDRLGYRFIDSVFRSDRKVRVPTSAKQVLPSNGAELQEVLSQWDRSRRAPSQFLAVTPLRPECGVFRHPTGGWMSLPQVLQFFSVHMVHHGFQIERLRDASEQAGVL